MTPEDRAIFTAVYEPLMLAAHNQEPLWPAIEAGVDAVLKRYQWQEITPENLPKVGDEVLTVWESTSPSLGMAESEWENRRHIASRIPMYRRPINPPTPSAGSR